MMPYVPLVGGDIWNTDSAGVPLSMWKTKIEALMAVVADHHVVLSSSSWCSIRFMTAHDTCLMGRGCRRLVKDAGVWGAASWLSADTMLSSRRLRSPPSSKRNVDRLLKEAVHTCWRWRGRRFLPACHSRWSMCSQSFLTIGYCDLSQVRRQIILFPGYVNLLQKRTAIRSAKCAMPQIRTAFPFMFWKIRRR